MAASGGNATFPICDAQALKAVIHGLKPLHPRRHVFRRCRRRAEGQRNIPFHEGLPLLGAEDRRMDVVAWLRGLGLGQYEAGSATTRSTAPCWPSLMAEDLRDLGVSLVGHRPRLARRHRRARRRRAHSGSGAGIPDARAPADAERRQLTVMFCDPVGSTALARLDPEDSARGHRRAAPRRRRGGRRVRWVCHQIHGRRCLVSSLRRVLRRPLRLDFSYSKR
jgi:SAM domain (Sterile alpha motif)